MNMTERHNATSAPKRSENDFIQSAMITALMRSVLSNETGVLRNPDYLSHHFVNNEWKILIENSENPFEMLNKRVPGSVIYMLLRTKYFDQSMTNWLNHNVDSQVIILGSGFDTRAHRICPKYGKGVTVYEVDLKGMLDYKKNIVESYSLKTFEGIKYIPVNFHEEDAVDKLISNGLDISLPTYVLCEGISFFLEEETVLCMLSKLNKTIKNKLCIAMDYVFRDYVKGNLEYYGAAETNSELKALGEPHLFGVDYHEVSNFFSNIGYKVKNNYTSKMLEQVYLCEQSGEHSQGSPCSFFGLLEITN